MSKYYNFLENLSKEEQERIRSSVQCTIETIALQSQKYIDSYQSIKQLYQKTENHK